MNINIQLIKDKKVVTSDFINEVDWNTREMYSLLTMITRLDDYEIEQINELMRKFIADRL